MKYFTIEVMPLAERDLEDIWLRIAEYNPVAADKILRLLNSRILTLATMPERGRRRQDIALDTRQLIEGNYIILYKIVEDTVVIVRVVHGSMDLPKLVS